MRRGTEGLQPTHRGEERAGPLAGKHQAVPGERLANDLASGRRTVERAGPSVPLPHQATYASGGPGAHALADAQSSAVRSISLMNGPFAAVY